MDLEQRRLIGYQRIRVQLSIFNSHNAPSLPTLNFLSQHYLYQAIDKDSIIFFLPPCCRLQLAQFSSKSSCGHGETQAFHQTCQMFCNQILVFQRSGTKYQRLETKDQRSKGQRSSSILLTCRCAARWRTRERASAPCDSPAVRFRDQRLNHKLRLSGGAQLQITERYCDYGRTNTASVYFLLNRTIRSTAGFSVSQDHSELLQHHCARS